MSVRGRVLAVSAAILLVTLALWSLLMRGLLEQWMSRVATAHARADATLLADQLERNETFDLPRSSADPVTVWQIVTADGIVLGTSLDAATSPVSDLRPPVDQVATTRVEELAGDGDPFIVAAATVATSQGPQTVLVAQALHLEELPETTTMLAVALSAAATLFVGGGLVRWSLNASLAPVERMRGQLAEITHPGGSGRVTVPRTGDELEHLGETLNELLDRLDASWTNQREFVANAGHELRTPLAVIRSHVDLGGDPATWSESRPTIDAEAQRLQSLVDDLLTLSRMDAGALPLDLTDCDLDDLVVDEVRRLEPARVPIQVSVSPVRLTASSARVRQIVTNLLTNALRHANGTVRVLVEEGLETGIVHVDNDGTVVPAADRDRVFERFVRLDDMRDRASGGTGIGLAIAAELAAAHSGKLVCGEAEDGWCRFTLELPRRQTPPQ